MAKTIKTTYKSAGVDIQYAEKLIEGAKKKIKETFRPEVLSEIGGFSGLFKVNTNSYTEPVLVSSTDGVGTKLKLAFASGIHNTVGIDLVAMCVNDVLVTGAEPVFMLDYIAAADLKSIPFENIISGIVEGCKIAGCTLLGGETAEMPGMYKKGEYDLAGFSLGIVEQDRIIDGSSITAEDAVVGLASSGLHSNGFSLMRKVFFSKKKYPLDKFFPELGRPLIEELLEPTRIYVKILQSITKNFDIHGIAHITGGGIPGNLVRILPAGTKAIIDQNSWDIPPIFDLIQREGNVPKDEMWKTFNMGIGMVLIINKEDVESLIEYLTNAGERAFLIGGIRKSNNGIPSVILEGGNM